MLPVLSKDLRVTRPADFTAVLRSGSRAGTRHLAVSLRPATGSASSSSTRDDGRAAVSPDSGPSASNGLGATPVRAARAGFVVSGAVGNSVVRHRVTRRLREQIRPLLETLPAGTDVVVRAFPAAAGASSEQLGRDLRSALKRVRSR